MSDEQEKLEPPAKRLFGGGGIAGQVVDQLGIDPAAVQRIVDNVESITASVAQVASDLAALSGSLRNLFGTTSQSGVPQPAAPQQGSTSPP